jgi:hypothetical protein
LAQAKLLDADFRGDSLAAVFVHPDVRYQATVLRVFRVPGGVPVGQYPMKRDAFVLSDDGRLLAVQTGHAQVQVHDVLRSGVGTCVTPSGRFHHDVQVTLGAEWLHLHNGVVVHRIAWADGHLRCDVLPTSCRPDADGIFATKAQLPPWVADHQRFQTCAAARLFAVVDVFGQVALFGHDGTLVCMVFSFRNRLAACTPDGTRYGPKALLGKEPTPRAGERIGLALKAATERASRGAQP